MTSLTIADLASREKAMPKKKWVKKTSAGKAENGKLTAAARQALPKSSFALPGKGEGPKGAGAGSYPIPDASHARNALSRVAQHGSPEEKARVRAAVHAKYPGIGSGDKEKKRSPLHDHPRSP